MKLNLPEMKEKLEKKIRKFVSTVQVGWLKKENGWIVRQENRVQGEKRKTDNIKETMRNKGMRMKTEVQKASKSKYRTKPLQKGSR